MCAIAGVLDLPMPDGSVESMLATMRRRGPDGRGVYRNGNRSMLHSRLAIIDPDTGTQPMILDREGERYILIYNGELYNTVEINQKLTAKGHKFLGHSDTEVVLHAYAEWGEDCLHLLNGIFSFAVLEEKKGRLFLARDRIGVKPLFYKRHEGGLIFASEIKTILAYPTVKAELDREGAAQVLLLGPGRMPGSGVFRGISEVEPGWCGYYEDGKLSLKRYWYLRDQEHRDSFPETAEKVRYLVLDSIKRQMVSDVPLGTFLSGGLDSSIISAVCAGEMGNRGERLKTFSVDYENNEKYFLANKFQPNSDSPYIQVMTEYLKSDHRGTYLTPDDLNSVLEEATIARDLPGMADVDFSLLAFCRNIRQDVKVALSGECADEIFGGYPWYRDPEVRARDGFPWAQNTMQRLSLLGSSMKMFPNPGDYVMDAYLDTCRQSDILPGASAQETRMKQMVNLNFRWFMQTLLDRKDRMSMFHSLEVRVPFCDYRIAEYLYGVPWEFKDYQGQEKGLLRKAMEGILPEEVLYRKKSPYPKTFDPRYEELMRHRLEALLETKTAPLFELVDRDAVRKIMDSEPLWPWYGQLMRRPQTMAYLVQLNFWLEVYNVNILV